MKLIGIGFGNLVSAGRIIAIVSPDSGRSTKAVITMDSGNVILSALTPETLAARCADNSEEGGYKDE